MTEIKNINISRIPRNHEFLFSVQGIGISKDNPPLRNVSHIYPNKIEINIRTLPAPSDSEQAQLEFGGQVYNLNYPHVIVKPPLMPYTYLRLKERDAFYIEYSPMLYQQMARTGLFQKPLAWEITFTPVLNELMSRLQQLWNNASRFGAADNIDLTCFQIISELLLQRNIQQQPLDPDREQIMKIDSYLRIHFNEKICWEETASQFGFSRATFFRLWGKYIPDTPARYLLKMRLNEACRLLRETRYRVNEIAQIVNISDYAYFCSVFRKSCGQSPLQYRKEAQIRELNAGSGWNMQNL